MWHFKNISIIPILLLVYTSCSEPEVIIPPLEVSASGKKVLIEDLTGVRCPNCPSANARLEAIKAIYGDDIIIVGVHGDLLTRPLNESRHDFRNPGSIALEEYLGPLLGKPSAVINRKRHPEFSMLANPLQDQWQTIVERELQLPQRMVLEMDIVQQDEDYQVNIGILPLENLGSGYHLHCMITENHIVDAQEDVDRILNDYEHNHVLRNIITPLEGMAINEVLQESVLINTTLNITGSQLQPFTIMENMEVILFLTDPMGNVEQVNLVSIQ